MGIPLYNKELITIAAKKSGLTEEAIAASETQRSGSLIYSLYMMGNTMPLADQVYILQSNVRVANAKVRPDAKDMPDRLWETHLAKHDRARASYYNYYTENRWGEAKNYDLCLNAAIGQDACAQLIVQAAKAMEAANQE